MKRTSKKGLSREEEDALTAIGANFGEYGDFVSLFAHLATKMMTSFLGLQNEIDEVRSDVQRLKVKTKNLGSSSNGKNQQLDTIRGDVCSLRVQVERLKIESFKSVHHRLNIIEATIPLEVRMAIKDRLIKEQENYHQGAEHEKQSSDQL